MKYYEIIYKYEGEKYWSIEQPHKGCEEQFPQQVLDRIESLVASGAVIVNLIPFNTQKEGE